MRLAFVAAITSIALQAQTKVPDLLKNVRIALRLDSGKVLIVVGAVSKKGAQTIYDASLEALPFDSGHAALQPI
jgi:hypothetical protein